MSLNGSLSGISFAGLSSGIDTDTIVRQLIQLESLPLRRLEFQKQQLEGRRSLMEQLRTKVRGFATAASALNSAFAFEAAKATSSDPAVATANATSTANAGTYTLRVTRLAQAHKFSTDAQQSANAALNRSGEFVINGKGIKVVASDSLTTIAQKINNARAGVTASVIDGGAGNVYLSLTASQTGASSKVQLADVGSGTLLTSLGIINGSATIRQPITNGVSSYGFSNPNEALSELLDLDGIPSSIVGIGSGTIAVDGSDTLTTIASKINDPLNGTGVTATVRQETVNGQTRNFLEITGTGATNLTDQNGFLEMIGVLQRNHKNETLAAQDAQFTLDGVSLTSASNTVTTVIPGVTLTLLKGNSTDPPTTTITVSRDTEAIKKNFQSLQSSYNALVDFIRKNSQFDKETFRTGPLFGDPAASQIEGSIANMLFNEVRGAGGPYRNLAALGFGLDEEGKLTLDEGELDKAIAADPRAVSALMRAVGSGSNDSIEFISAGSRSKPSGPAGYAIEITQAATRGVYTTTETTGTLTFKGALFGSSQPVFTLTGNLDQDVARMNADARLRDLVTAENVGGQLRITSKRYGEPGNFVVEGVTGTMVDGLNVAGTINGERATGSGQFLTGNQGNATTDGLQILYTGTATGSVGTIRFSKGVATQVMDLLETYTDAANGLLSATDRSLQGLIDDIGVSIKGFQERLQLRERTYRDRFQAMERAIAQLQTQQQRLGAIRGR
jgi:flagellar hook-associated protein 2